MLTGITETDVLNALDDLVARIGVTDHVPAAPLFAMCAKRNWTDCSQSIAAYLQPPVRRADW